MDYVIKALDSVVGANFERKDLSDLITLQDGPERPLLRMLAQGRAKGKTHFWDEQGLIAPTGSTGFYAEGGKPTADAQSPVQMNNVTFRVGKTAAVTDTERAIWTGAGSYRLADGELERLYQDAIDFQVKLKTTEVLNEMEYIFLQGARANNSSSVSQCDGVTTWMTLNAPATNLISYTGSPALSENFLRDAGRIQRAQKTPYKPDILLCTFAQKEIINSFAPETRVQITGASGEQGLVGGVEVGVYNTGYSRVKVQDHPWMPSGTMLMLHSGLLKRADLIPLGAEPLARIATSVERMVTYEGTLEFRLAKAHIMITGLAA